MSVWLGEVRWKVKVFWPPFPCLSKTRLVQVLCRNSVKQDLFDSFLVLFFLLLTHWKRSSKENWWCGDRSLLHLQQNSCSSVLKMPLKVSLDINFFFYGYKMICWERKLTADKMEHKQPQGNFLIAWSLLPCYFLKFWLDIAPLFSGGKLIWKE